MAPRSLRDMQTVAVGGERLVETSHVRRAWDTLRGGHRALLLLGPVGAGSFWSEMVEWVVGSQDTATTLDNIEASWPA